MDFRNSTRLNSQRLHRLFVRHTTPYRHDKLRVNVRYSRGADFSGSCYYRDALIYVNIGAKLGYPYAMATHLAKARNHQTHWSREAYIITLANAEQLALFIYLHELFHYLVKQAGRAPGRKEGMCDRFAATVLVDDYGAPVTDPGGRPVSRAAWDFKDLHAFVAAAPRQTSVPAPPPRPPRTIPVIIHGLNSVAARKPTRPGSDLDT